MNTTNTVGSVEDCKKYGHVPTNVDVAFWKCATCGKDLEPYTIEDIVTLQQQAKAEERKRIVEALNNSGFIANIVDDELHIFSKPLQDNK